MNDLEHLPLPPDEPRQDQKNEPVRLTEVPVDWVQQVIPPPPVAVPLSKETTLVATSVPSQGSIKKVRLKAVLITILLAGIAALMSGAYGLYYNFSQSLRPLNHLHAKPVVRTKRPVVLPVQKKAPSKAHARHRTRKSAQKKSSTNSNSSSPSIHKPWFSNSGQKGA